MTISTHEKWKAEKTDNEALYRSFECSTLLIYNAPKCNYVQQICVAEQHIEVCIYVKKIRLTIFMMFHFKMLWHWIISCDLTLIW